MPFSCAITLPLVISGGLGSADSSLSSFTQAAASFVASSVCAGLPRRLAGRTCPVRSRLLRVDAGSERPY
jgi:hypothetical protein